MEQRSDPGDIDTAVQEVIEALSPRSSLRISKEIIKNQLSSWIMSIEEEIEEKKVNKEPQRNPPIIIIIGNDCTEFIHTWRCEGHLCTECVKWW